MANVEYDDQPFVDPDELKVPQSPLHRRSADLVVAVADALVGPEWAVYGDMNWYPPDGGPPMAPDAMVLPAGALPAGAKSYRQDRLDGPPPRVIVEIPSLSDTYGGMWSKVARAKRLGVVLYVVDVESDEFQVMRHSPGSDVPASWLDQPVEELGGIVFGRTGRGDMNVVLPDGLVLASTGESVAGLLRLARNIASAEASAAAAHAEAAAAHAEAARAHARIAELEARLGPAERPSPSPPD